MRWTVSIFQDNSFRLRALKYLEKELPSELLAKIGLPAKRQTHERESLLRGLAPQAEAALNEPIEAIDSLDLVPRARQAFMRALRGYLGQSIVEPFIPSALVDIRFPQLFECITEYKDARGNGALQAYEKARQVVADFEAAAACYDTQYTRRYLVGLAKRLGGLLKEDFQRNPLGRAAELDIAHDDKKYPLHSADQRIEFAFNLENKSSGYAFGTFVEVIEATDLSFERKDAFLGQVEPGRVQVRFEGTTTCEAESILIEVQATWSDFDGTEREVRRTFELESQGADRDWESLERREVYHLEPVSDKDELVGRSEILGKLHRLIGARNIGSAFVIGQKRVGKTSIAKTLQSQLEEGNSGVLPVYLLTGSYVASTAAETVRALGEQICDLIRHSDERLSHIPPPDFTGALNPLASYLQTLGRVLPGTKLLIILDEFDELPLELYRRSPEGDAFFLTIRSISTMPNVGFILVGGERMGYVVSRQGDRLNKFIGAEGGLLRPNRPLGRFLRSRAPSGGRGAGIQRRGGCRPV